MKNIRISSLILAGVLCLVTSSAAFAEETNRDANGNIVRGPYLTAGFWDNWYIELGAGPSIYLGGINNNFGERICPVFDVAFGKRITPSSGIRTSFNVTPKYKEFQSGLGEYNFYYWNIHADYLWNVLNTIFGYRENRVYQLIPYIGGGYAQIGGLEDFYGVSHGFTLNGGVINKFRLSDIVDLNVEFRASACTHTHDHIIDTKTTIDAPFSMVAGLTVKLGKQGFQRASSYAAGQVDMAVAKALAAKDGELSALKAENGKLAKEVALLSAQPVKAADTTIVVNNIGEFPPEVIVFFDLNKSTLNPKEDSHFQTFVHFVKQSIKFGKKVTLIGSADKQTGNYTINMKLAKERAELVKSILVNQYGISAGDLDTVAEGDQNNRFQDQEMNRCVWVRF